MMKNPFGSLRRRTRIDIGTPTEFIFCSRSFGAVIVDTSETGMKLLCDIRLGIGSIIHLTSPVITGRIIWRDDENKLMGIEFVKTPQQCLGFNGD